MQILRLEVEESKLDKDFMNISQTSLESIWNNEEDRVYDKYLKIQKNKKSKES